MKRRPSLSPRRMLKEDTGNIAVSAALVAPLIIGTLALGVDYGHLTMQQRALQQAADLSAIVAASSLSNPGQAAFDYFKMNGLDMPVATATGLITDTGVVSLDKINQYSAVATVTTGRYTADPALSVDARFVQTNSYPDAVRVEVRRKETLFFASAFADPPTLGAVGTAAANKMASFSIGTRLASLHGGVLNAVLSGLLGTSVSLDVMDYRALIDADVAVLKTLDALAIDLGLTAVTYEELLQTDVSFGKVIDAVLRQTTLDAKTRSALEALKRTVAKTKLTVKLENVLNPGPYSERLIGSADHLTVDVGVFEFLTAAAAAANGKNQVAVDLGATFPGLASAKLSIAIGAPPVSTPPAAVGGVGTIVRTAQTRVALNVSTDGLLALAGIKVKVPLYIEVAHAEAKLTEIHCRDRSGSADVRIEAVPGVAEIALGNIDTSAFANFGTKPRVTKATLVQAPLLGIDAMAYINATNLDKKMLTFTPNEIASGTVKTVSTSQTLTTLQFSLLKNLDVDIRLAGLTLGTPQAVQNALAQTLANLTVPLDSLLYNTLLALGIRIGEADIRATYATCQQPVLVQ